MKTKKSMIMIAVVILLLLIVVGIGLAVKKSSEQEFIPLDQYDKAVNEKIIKKNIEELEKNK